MVDNPFLSDLDLICRHQKVIKAHSFILAIYGGRSFIAEKDNDRETTRHKSFSMVDFDRTTVMSLLNILYCGTFDKSVFEDAKTRLELRRCGEALELNDDTLDALSSPSSDDVENQVSQVSINEVIDEIDEILDKTFGLPNSTNYNNQDDQSDSGDEDDELEVYQFMTQRPVIKDDDDDNEDASLRGKGEGEEGDRNRGNMESTDDEGEKNGTENLIHDDPNDTKTLTTQRELLKIINDVKDDHDRSSSVNRSALVNKNDSSSQRNVSSSLVHPSPPLELSTTRVAERNEDSITSTHFDPPSSPDLFGDDDNDDPVPINDHDNPERVDDPEPLNDHNDPEPLLDHHRDDRDNAKKRTQDGTVQIGDGMPERLSPDITASPMKRFRKAVHSFGRDS